MNYMPIMENAQMDPSTILSMFKLGETDTVMDMVSLASSRMQEYFDKIIETGKQVEPRKNEDHQRMLSYAGQFVMMRAYQDLPSNLKQLIDDHIEARQSLLAAPPPPPGIATQEGPNELMPNEGEDLLQIPPDILNL